MICREGRVFEVEEEAKYWSREEEVTRRAFFSGQFKRYQGIVLFPHLPLARLCTANFCAPGLSTMRLEKRQTGLVRFENSPVLQMSLWDP